MKNSLTKRVTSLFLALLMVFGVMSTGLIVMAETRPLKYVSIGDSMTNGYGLDGYEEPQDNGSIKNWFGFQRNEVAGSYPFKVAEHFGWELSQIATSGLRADDVYYMLNLGTDNEVEWDEYGRRYMAEKFGQSYRDAHNGALGTDEEVIAWAAEIYQAEVEDADVVSIGIGSNNFATLMDMRMMWWMGRILGNTSLFGGYDGSFDFDNLVGELTDEEKQQINELYTEIEGKLLAAVSEYGISTDAVFTTDGATVGDFVKDITNAIAYTSAGFALGYKGIVDTIIRENDDAEIIIVGLTNWFRGMVYAMPIGDEVIELPLGDLMDTVCEFAGVYMAALPAYYKAQNKDMQPIYFADTNAAGVEDVELIVDVIVKNSSVDLSTLEGLEDDERFEAAKKIAEGIDPSAIPGGTTRARLLEAMGGFVIASMGMQVPTLKEIENFEAKAAEYNAMSEEQKKPYEYYAYTNGAPSGMLVYLGQNGVAKLDSCIAYLGLEKSMISSLHLDVVNVEHFKLLSSMENLMTVTGGALAGHMTTANPDDIAGALIAVPELLTVSNLMFNFLVGSGVIVHPSDDGHTTIANVIINAYENKITTGNYMDSLVKPYLDATIKHFENLSLELLGILEKNLKPVAEELEAELKVLGGELEAKLAALDAKLAELTEKEEVILADMLAEREAIAAELEALEEELAGIYAAPVSANGITKKMSATTVADTAEELEAELEAAIAETKAALEALEAEILAVKNQIETDKSGIEAIEAAIEVIKANIAETEAALAEVNAAIAKLVADLKALGIDLEALAEAAKNTDPEEVYEAVKGIFETLPEVIATVEDLYNTAVEAIEDAKAAVEAVKASAETIKTNVENLIDSAKDLVAIEGEKAEAIKATAEEIYALAEEFVIDNLPTVEEALEKTATEVEEVIAEEIAKAEALWAEYGDLVMAALYIAYEYCDEKGYIDLAEETIEGYIAEVEAKLETLKGDLSNAEAELEDILANLELEYEIEIDTEVVIAKIEAYIANIEAEIEKAEAALETLKANVELIASDAKAVVDALGNLKNELCDLGNAVCDLKEAVKDEVLTLVGYANQIGEKALAVVDTLDTYADLFTDGVVIVKNEIIKAIEEAIYNATHADYEKDADSYYVAFGDGTAVSESYVDLLAAELEVKYNNLAQEGLKVEDMFDIIDANVAEIKKADLITIGFGNNTFITEAMNYALDYENAPEFDWAKYVGEDGAKYVAEALAELKAMLDEEGLGNVMGMPASDLAVIAIEAYAYSCVEYAVNLPIVANAISEINPEALVILVGMYNPLDGVVIDLGETKLDVSEYLTYLAKAADLESLIYAIVTGDAIYVDAPAVDTKLEDEALDILDIINEFAVNQGENLDPNAAGHEYIKGQILEALNVTKVALLGDANNDGEVNAIDAMYILQYDAEIIEASELHLELSDVNGDGKVNSIDAMYVLRYDAELIEKFPAEKAA